MGGGGSGCCRALCVAGCAMIQAAGPISAFGGSGGFDGGTASGQSDGQSANNQTFNFAPPQGPTVAGLNANWIVGGLVAVGIVWVLAKR